jgi:CHAD domain-containing protein
MGYRLEEREGMAGGVRRIAREELGKAIDQLEGRAAGDPDEAVHDARKRLKKARSALRLVRYDVGNAVRRRENQVMRDAARSLSGVRDAQVLLETLDALATESREPSLPADAVRALRRSLEQRRERLREERAAAAPVAAAELAGVLERVTEWPLDDEGFEAARSGLQRVQRRGRRAMAAALESGDDESWHEWRKRAKDLWYCMRILEPVAPGPVGALVEDAGELSDLLGEDHDLATLDDAVAEHGGEIGDPSARLLREAVARRREDLRRRALPIGMRLYGEKPGAFARRIASYWDARAALSAPTPR